MTVSAKLSAVFEASQLGVHDFAPPNFNVTVQDILQFSMGGGSGQANLLFVDERTLASAANDDLDLNGTALQTVYGVNIAATTLVAALIINAPKLASAAPNTTNLTIGGGTSPVTGLLGGTTPTLGPMKPGEVLLRHASVAAGLCTVTAGTADILRVANSAGAAATYQILIIGASA
jgi:hypothetical protein